MLGNQVIEGLGISSIFRADSHTKFFGVYVYHPQNPVALNNFPSMKLASSNFTFVDLDNVVGTSNFASRNIFVLHRQLARFTTITKPVTYRIVRDWTVTRRVLSSCLFIRQFLCETVCQHQYLGWRNLVVLKPCALCAGNCYSLMASSACKQWISFIAVMMQPQMSVAFTTSYCCMKQAVIKQKLNARAIFHNNWYEVKFVHEAIHAGSYTSG
jgi:hypothetical protein